MGPVCLRCAGLCNDWAANHRVSSAVQHEAAVRVEPIMAGHSWWPLFMAGLGDFACDRVGKSTVPERTRKYVYHRGSASVHGFLPVGTKGPEQGYPEF